MLYGSLLRASSFESVESQDSAWDAVSLPAQWSGEALGQSECEQMSDVSAWLQQMVLGAAYLQRTGALSVSASGPHGTPSNAGQGRRMRRRRASAHAGCKRLCLCGERPQMAPPRMN